jgi:hypothetical protein
MELDSLKELWREQDEVMVHRNADEDILSMLRKKSQSPIAKIKRNLGWELIAIIVLYSFTIWYYIRAWHGRYWEIAVLLSLIGISFVVYYYRKNKLLKEMLRVDYGVKYNLEQRLTTLEKYVRIYFVSGTVLTPATYFVAGMIVFFKTPSRTASEKIPPMFTHITGQDYFILFTVSGVALAIGCYFLNIWYVKKLYGQHIDKLKDLLHQTKETDQ